MFLGLKKYLGPNEQILYRFGLSLRYILVTIFLWSILLLGLALWFRKLEADLFFVRLPLIILIIICLYYTFLFLSTAYFVTNKKIYKRIGIGFVKLTSAKHNEIDDMVVVQDLFERIFFNTGTLKFNTPGSNGYEIIMPKVEDPYGIKNEIYNSWEKVG